MGGELSGRKGPSANQADADAQEIAQMIGSSRRRQLLQVIGLTLVIRNKSAWEGLVTG